MAAPRAARRVATMFSPQYRALAAAVLLFTAAILISSYHIVREYELITGKFVPNLWVAAQAEIEYFRFINQLERHTFDDAEESQELATRLYIFGSRLPLLLQGSESDHVRAIEGAPETVERLSDTLEQLEPAIVALRRGDAAAYRTIYAALKPFEIPLHQIVANTMLKDEEIAASQREEIRKVYWEVLWCIAGITVSASILVVLLFRAFRSASRSLELAHAAEAAETAARAQLKAVIDAVPARISARDRDGRPVFRNRYAAELECGPTDGAENDTCGLDALDRRVIESGEPVPLFEELGLGEADGQRAWLTTKVPLCDPGGSVANVVTVSLDISAQKEAQRRNALLATAVEHAGDAIEITDAAGRFRYVNPAFERISGYTREEAIGETPFTLLLGDASDEPYYRSVQNVIEGGQVWHDNLTARRKDGQLYHQEATISPVRDVSGEVSHYVAVKRDITDRLRAQEQIWHLAHHDPLTDLPNRTLFEDRLEQALVQARRNGQLVALLFLDLDKFKDVNDTLGHHCGDQLLGLVSRRLRASTRDIDTVARLGGDEFAVIQTGLTDPRAAGKLGQRLLGALAEPFAVGGQELHVSASVGITVFPADGSEAQRLLCNADLAMYKAKASGRAACQFFEEGMNRAAQARKSLERDLRRALANGEATLAHQPQGDGQHGTPTGAGGVLPRTAPDRGPGPPPGVGPG